MFNPIWQTRHKPLSPETEGCLILAIDVDRVSGNDCALDLVDADENTDGSDAGFSDEFMSAGEMNI